MRWNRYRFFTTSVEDYRPMIFDSHFPWWCTGFTGDEQSASIIAYLPQGESLEKYWPEAFDVTVTENELIIFTTRFPRPEWYQEIHATCEREG